MLKQKIMKQKNKAYHIKRNSEGSGGGAGGTFSTEEKNEMKNEMKNDDISLGDRTAFDPNYIKQMEGGMSDEQKSNFKNIGEDYYKNIDINENGDLENLIVLAVFEITEALKSGLDPKELSQQDLDILVNNLGDDWYVPFGFQKEDLKDGLKDGLKQDLKTM